MKNKLILIFLLAVGFLQAQETKVLTLKDAITFALENKADAKNAKLEVENSDYQIQEVRSRALPQISATGSLNVNPILQLNALPGDFFGAPGTTILAPLGQKWNSVAGVSLPRLSGKYIPAARFVSGYKKHPELPGNHDK